MRINVYQRMENSITPLKDFMVPSYSPCGLSLFKEKRLKYKKINKYDSSESKISMTNGLYMEPKIPGVKRRLDSVLG